MIQCYCDNCGNEWNEHESAFDDSSFELQCEDCGSFDVSEGYEDDCQPSEYEEWQDVYGGDVEEYGTFGDY